LDVNHENNYDLTTYAHNNQGPKPKDTTLPAEIIEAFSDQSIPELKQRRERS